MDKPEPRIGQKKGPGWLLGSGLVLASVVIIAQFDPPKTAPAQAPGAPSQNEIDDLAESMRLVVPGGEVFTFAIPSDSSAALIEAAGKKRCEGTDFCQVRGWMDPAQVPTSWPMLDREAAALSFSYLLNRQTGFEKLTWYCGSTGAGPKCEQP